MRRFSCFSTAKSPRAQDCTYERYLEWSNDKRVLQKCNEIAAETDADKRGELKKQLPVITWQSAFDGKRNSKEAKPSGLFMLDIDHVDEPGKLYADKVGGRVKELGIVYVGMTASRHGLRIVAKCRKEFGTLGDCQKWLAAQLEVEFDGVCKDWARCSFMVHDSYTYYMDAKAIWQDDPEEGEVYSLDGAYKPNVEMEKMLEGNPNSSATSESHLEDQARVSRVEDGSANGGGACDQREGLFGGPSDYKGVPYEDIAREWLEYTGGEPTEGERNARLYKLALRMRYITDFNEATMLRIMPSYGLPKSEMTELIRHALSATRAQDLPKDLRETLDRIDRRIKLTEDEEGIPEIITSTDKMPPLPPLFREWCEVAPGDFKQAVALCQLPILGALGSRLRAEYLDGKKHSPSFQVSLEAPQASGKSFLVRLVNYELAQMLEADEAAREAEREYQNKVNEMKMLNIKVNADNKDQILGTKPNAIIRYLPATISITMLLKRMYNAKGLHCFALAEEVDTVQKAYKRGFSNLSEMLRVSFDNGLYGQDYASENSWSGNIPLYYNTLFSGTPKAMRRFYPDVEDGLVSRVLFVTLPDQFGKKMPIWGEFTREQKQIVDIALTRLNEISLQGSDVQPEHVMKLAWLNKALSAWIAAQQAEAVRTDDRTRDAFCRRSAVVGFRAGMLAWFLYEEKGTPTIRRKVSEFAIWVANCMLNQHLLRFNIQGTNSNVNHWESVYKQLADEFTREELQRVLDSEQVDTPIRQVVYKWKLLGIVEELDKGRGGKYNRKQSVKFKKVRK